MNGPWDICPIVARTFSESSATFFRFRDSLKKDKTNKGLQISFIMEL